jgi:hypothetical protein
MSSLLPSFRGLWGLLWRSMVVLPVAIVLMTLYLAFWVAVMLLPVTAVFLAFFSEWIWAGTTIAMWIPLLFLTRWNRLHVDSRDTLNEHENV